MQAFRKIFSLLLLTVFFIETTPDELLHLLTNHHDTLDSNSTTAAVSTKHIHCEALQLSLPAFSSKDFLKIPSIQISVTTQEFSFPTLHTSSAFIIKNGRGPPAVA